MVVAADDIGDAHVVVVDDDGEHVSRTAVGAQQHEVVEVLVGEGDAALHLVVDHRLALLRRAQADHRLHAGGRLGGIAVAPAAVVARRAVLGARLLAHLRELLGRGVTLVGVALGEQFLGDLAVTRRAGELVHDLAVPFQPQPLQPVDDRGDGRLRRALAIGVLDAQQHAAAEMARVKPVEQRGARPADMQEAGRRGGEARDDRVGHGRKTRVMGAGGRGRLVV